MHEESRVIIFRPGRRPRTSSGSEAGLDVDCDYLLGQLAFVLWWPSFLHRLQIESFHSHGREESGRLKRNTILVAAEVPLR